MQWKGYCKMLLKKKKNQHTKLSAEIKNCFSPSPSIFFNAQCHRPSGVSSLQLGAKNVLSRGNQGWAGNDKTVDPLQEKFNICNFS